MPLTREQPYIPPPYGAAWRRGETGLDPAALAAAAAHVAAHETPWSRDVESEIVRGFSEPPPWIERSTAPTRLNPKYGFTWILNTGRQTYPSAPVDGYGASGSGGNLVWIDPVHDLVAVVCWTDPAAIDGFLERVGKALPAAPSG